MPTNDPVNAAVQDMPADCQHSKRTPARPLDQVTEHLRRELLAKTEHVAALEEDLVKVGLMRRHGRLGD